MRLLGRCTECGRYRYVRVGSSGYVRAATQGVCEGLCVECEEVEDEKRRARHRPAVRNRGR